MASNVRVHFKKKPQGNVQNFFGVSTNIFVWLNENYFCRNPSLGLATKAKGVAKLQAKRKPGSHSACFRECKKSVRE